MRVIRVLLVLLACTPFGMLPPASRAQVLVSVTVAPPPLPVYVQPGIPGPNYMWVPGYWAWDFDDYYWVPGTWVLAPAPGLLWTPGYWAWGGTQRHGTSPLCWSNGSMPSTRAPGCQTKGRSSRYV